MLVPCLYGTGWRQDAQDVKQTSKDAYRSHTTRCAKKALQNEFKQERNAKDKERIHHKYALGVLQQRMPTSETETSHPGQVDCEATGFTRSHGVQKPGNNNSAWRRRTDQCRELTKPQIHKSWCRQTALIDVSRGLKQLTVFAFDKKRTCLSR